MLLIPLVHYATILYYSLYKNYSNMEISQLSFCGIPPFWNSSMINLKILACNDFPNWFVWAEWLECIEEYIPAWKELADLDKFCWVLDPDPPTPGNRKRVNTTFFYTLLVNQALDPSNYGKLFPCSNA